MLTNKRGNVLLFTIVLVVPVLLIFAGLATDMAYYGDIDNELQRAMDAAALAGAGKLGFSADNFPDARQWAHDYAQLNKYRGGSDTINLDPNTANATTGNVVILGIWDPTARSFSPSLNGNLVNAVKTQFSTTIPTSFLRIIGVSTLNSFAQAIAWAPVPAIPSDCVFPVALSWDGSFPGSDPEGNALCGKPASFISSSPNSAVGFNTAGWADISQVCGNPSAANIKQEVNDAAGGCAAPPVKTGDYITINGGMVDSAFNDTVPIFKTKFAASEEFQVTQTVGGEPVTVYTGKGWKVMVPVVDKATQTGSCPVALSPFKGTMLAGAWDKLFCVGKAFAAPPAGGGGSGGGGSNQNQSMKIKGWTQFLITQVINGGDCTVDNPSDNTNKSSWPGPNPNWSSDGRQCSNGSAPANNALRGIYGFYNCEIFSTPGGPGVVGSLGKPKLVK